MQKDSKMQIYYMDPLQMHLLLAQLKINQSVPSAIKTIDTTLKTSSARQSQATNSRTCGDFFPNKNTYFKNP